MGTPHRHPLRIPESRCRTDLLATTQQPNPIGALSQRVCRGVSESGRHSGTRTTPGSRSSNPSNSTVISAADRGRPGVVVDRVSSVHTLVGQDLVNVPDGRNSGADIELLGDARVGAIGDHPAQERAICPGRLRDARQPAFEFTRPGPVRGEIVRPAQQMIVDPGDIGTRGSISSDAQSGSCGTLHISASLRHPPPRNPNPACPMTTPRRYRSRSPRRYRTQHNPGGALHGDDLPPRGPTPRSRPSVRSRERRCGCARRASRRASCSDARE